MQANRYTNDNVHNRVDYIEESKLMCLFLNKLDYIQLKNI